MNWQLVRLRTVLTGRQQGLIAGLANGIAGFIGSRLRDAGLGMSADENTARTCRPCVLGRVNMERIGACDGMVK